jgi:hypothetical protein
LCTREAISDRFTECIDDASRCCYRAFLHNATPERQHSLPLVF